MTSHRKNLLADPDFLARASAGDILRDALNEPAFVKQAAVADSRGNDIADPGTFIADLKTMNYFTLANKYGREVADNRSNLQRELETQYAIRNTPRTSTEKVIDTSLDAVKAVVGFGGGLAAAAVGIAGAGDEIAFGDSTVSEASTRIADATSDVTDFIGSFQSDNLQNRSELIEIEGKLDRQDSKDIMDQQIARGVSPTVANMERIGRDVLNTGERFYSDGVVGQSLIAGALGSVWPSAKLARGGQILAQKLAARTGNKTAQRIAATIGSAAGISIGEASGTYADTSSFVMGLSEADMYSAPEYARLRSEGKNHEEAQRIVAASTALEASARQLPVAAVLGLVAARFNANPIGVFKGKGLLDIFRETGIQVFEEAGQGASSVLSQNIAVSNQIDAEQDLFEGFGDALAEGGIAGFGIGSVLGAPSAAKSVVVSSITGAVSAADLLKKAATSAAVVNTAGAILNVAVKGGQAVASRVDKAIQVGVIDVTGEGRGEKPVNIIAEKAADVVDAAAKLAKKVAEKAEPVTTPVVAAGKKVIAPIKQAVSRAASRPNKQSQAETRNASTKALKLDPENKTLKAMVRVTELLSKTRVEDFTARQILGTAGAIASLRDNVNSWTPELKALGLKILSSTDIADIETRLKTVDLSTIQTEKTVVTPEVVAETLAVAQINPANVHPEVIDRILKHELAKDMTEEQLSILALAGEIATILNTHRGKQIQILKDKKIGLSRRPDDEVRDDSDDEVPSLGEKASRSLQIGGFTDARGKKLPSINDLAADILEGAQSKDGTIRGDGTVNISVKNVTKQLRMLSTHMKNKVDALNLSIQNGEKVGFESLVGGTHMVPATDPASANPVQYHSNSPGSEANARRIHSDAVAAASVYNALLNKFPKHFTGGPIEIAKLLPGDTTTIKTTTPAVEAASETTSTEAPAKGDVDGKAVEQAKTDTKEIPDTTAGDEAISAQPQIDEEADPQTNETPEGDVIYTEEDDDGKARNTPEAETEEVSIPISEGETEKVKNTDPVTKKFGETFKDRGDEVGYESGNDILNLLIVGTNTTQGYRDLAKKVFATMIKGMNARLRTVPIGPNDKRSPKTAILAGETLSHIRDFKNTMLVDPKTGEYDPDLLSIAVVAMIDWMSSVKSSDPSKKQLSKTLSNLGLTLAKVTDEQMQDILHGVPPSFVAEQVSKTIIRMWNKKIDGKGQMVDARGAAEGLVKEMIEVMVDKFDLVTLHNIPVHINLTKGTNKKKKIKETTTPTLNIKGLKEIQKAIGLDGQNSVQKLLTPEDNRGPSIGEKIKNVDTRNQRGTANLSSTEQRALKAQQDTPHRKAKGITSLIGALGFAIYAKMSGQEEVSHLAKGHPLRNSIEGKNLSIQRDWDDAHLVTDQLQDENENTPVYFRISITKVGRHQHQGINSQNNKTLRVMVSPSGDTLDMTKQDDIDGFWLTIAQSSGIFKVENILHDKILADIQSEFAKKYGDAVALVETHITTGKLDADALLEATGQISMEQLNAIYAVADFNTQSRKTNALTEFHVTLGFELDGKTDGPAHMMNSFGQGLLTPEDYTNFQRVGLFLGQIGRTLNSFFNSGKEQDLYNVASSIGMTELYSEMATAGPSVRAALYASARFAARFGDFVISADGLPEMTRDTAKNPMTKTVYGSGLRTVSEGIAEDMVMEFYRKMISVPKGEKASDYLGYADLEADFELLFNTKFSSKTDWTQSKFDLKSLDNFTDIVIEGIGTMISTAAKTVIGEPIRKVNDLLVFITNVQTEFLTLLYDKRLLELAEKLATDGTIKRNKDNKGIIRQIPVDDYKAMVKELNEYAPSYDNGVQILALGAFMPQPSNQEMSSTMEGKLQMKSTMEQPLIAGVKVIPYVTQGRGDAMVVNTIFSEKGAPGDILAVHDGFYVPIRKIKGYAKRVNEAVSKVWDRDVLGDIIVDFEGFVGKVGSDVELFKAAMDTVNDYPQDTTVKAKTAATLMSTLKEYHRQNQARKEVFQVIPKSVDHLAGAEEAFSTNTGEEIDRHEINELISDKLNQKRVPRSQDNDNDQGVDEHFRKLAADGMREVINKAAERDSTQINLPVVSEEKADTPGAQKDGILVTDTRTILEELRNKSKRLVIRETIKVLTILMVSNNYKVIIAKNAKKLAKVYDEVNGKGATDLLGLLGSKGWVDTQNQVMYIVSNNHETLAHELIHLATFNTVRAHFEGTKINNAVVRLDILMEEFLATDFSEGNKALANAARSSKAAILVHKNSNRPVRKAAALNEFMAWTLTNAALVKELKVRQTSIVARITKTALDLIRRVLGNKIPNSMYNHILFNTLMLSNVFDDTVTSADLRAKIDIEVQEQHKADSQAEISDLLDTADTGGGLDGVGNNTTGGNNNNDNSDGEVTPAADKLTNFWIDQMKIRLDNLKTGDDKTRSARTDQFKRYRDAARNALVKLDFGGFVMSPYQKQTFTAIHLVLATEMRLNTKSSISMNKVFEYVTTTLTPEMFGPGNAGQERYATIMDLLGDTKNDEGVSDAMAVLLAMSQTSKNFREALDQLPNPTTSKINDGTFNEYLTVVTGFLMNKALDTVETSGNNSKAMLDVLSENLLLQDVNKEFELLRALMGSMNKADKFVSGAMNQVAERVGKFDRNIQSSDRTLLTKVISGSIAMAANFLSNERAASTADLAKKLSHAGTLLDNFVPFREFIVEVVGTDLTNAEVTALLDRTNKAVSNIRQQYKEEIPVILQDAFETHPDETQWMAALHVLGKMDFANIFDLANPERAFALLKDNNLLRSQTEAKEAEINKAFSKKVSAIILEKSKQLAAHMNLKGAGHQLWKNAYSINKQAGKYDEAMTDTIDRLVSLYALEIADQTQKDIISKMFETDREATMNLVSYMQALNKVEDQKTISETARLNGNKGWVPNHAAKNARIIIERDDKGDALIKTGWIRVGTYEAEVKWSTVPMGYYQTTVKQTGSYSQGVHQSVQGTYRGVNSVTGLSISNEYSGVISGRAADAITTHLNDGTGVVDDMVVLVPVPDETGVLHYERYIHPDVLLKYSNPRQNLALMLGAWAGRQVEEMMAAQYNYELIVKLKEIYDARKPDEDNLFENMATSKDKVFQDTYDQLSPETRNLIEIVYGKNNGFMVKKDMVNLSLGYRDPSIMDLWTGNTRVPKFVQDVVKAAVDVIPGNRAVTVLSRTEEAVQSAVSTAKDLIVVRSLVVPYMNTQANVFQLLTRGVPVKVMKDGYESHFIEIERFNVNEKQRIVLDTKIAFAGNDADKVKILEGQQQLLLDENMRMGIWPLIEAGQYKNISEGITDLDVELTSGRMAEWVENQVNKLPGTVQTIAKYGILSKDTAIYKMANKAVQYGDFLAKVIMYHHLVDTQGVDKVTAIKKINEEFINFSVLPGRSRAYLEGFGGTWFLSFKIRSMKIAMNIMRDNPVRAMITMNTIGQFGSAIHDNLGNVIIERRFGYALGWDMLLNSYSLNPYVNMWEWMD